MIWLDILPPVNRVFVRYQMGDIMKKESIKGKQTNAFLEEKCDDYDEMNIRSESYLNFNGCLLELRQAHKLTQKELAERLKTSSSNISRVENNSSAVQMKTIIKFAAAVGKVVKITFENRNDVYK